jgi:adenosylcobinamide-GDP ribazoletransferase
MATDPTAARARAPRRHGLRAQLEGARAAVAFLTRLPVGGGAAGLTHAAAWFPVVGLLVGGAIAGVRALADLALPPGPSTVLALAFGVALTGALHEDGLADTADALGAHVDRARRLEILRDPRVGAYGALALGLALLFAYAALAPMSTGHFAVSVVVAHALSRWSALAQSRLVAPARRDGAGVLLRTSGAALAAGTIVAAAAAIALAGPAPGAVAAGLAAAVTVAGSLVVRHGLGGSTGDTYGAVAKAVELASYAVFAAAWA